MQLTLYSRPGCHLCEDMIAVIERLRPRAAFELQVVDISGDPALERRYGWDIPVLLLDGQKIAEHRVSEVELSQLLTKGG